MTTLVANEPPLITLTPDGPAAVRARAGVREAYDAGMRGLDGCVVIAVGEE